MNGRFLAPLGGFICSAVAKGDMAYAKTIFKMTPIVAVSRIMVYDTVGKKNMLSAQVLFFMRPYQSQTHHACPAQDPVARIALNKAPKNIPAASLPLIRQINAVRKRN